MKCKKVLLILLHFPKCNRLPRSVYTVKKLLQFLNFSTLLRDVTNMFNSNTETLNTLIKIAFLINHK